MRRHPMPKMRTATSLRTSHYPGVAKTVGREANTRLLIALYGRLRSARLCVCVCTCMWSHVEKGLHLNRCAPLVTRL